MIGPVANSVCIVAGSILGALCGPVLSQEFRKKIMNVFSCITLGIGVTMLSKGDSLPPVVLSLLFGTALGELTRFESLVMKGAFKVAGLFKRNGKAKGRQVRNAVRDGVPRSVRRGDGPFLRERPRDHRFHARRPDRRVFPPAHLGRARSVHGHAHFGEHRQCGGRAGRSAVRHSVCLAVRGHDGSCRTPRRPCLRISPLAAASSCSAPGLRQMGLVQVPILSMLPGLFFVMPLSALWKQIM